MQLTFSIQCINCAACSHFAPATFGRAKHDAAHIVHQQPSSDAEIDQARAALAACPVAAIRIETKAERRHRAEDKSAVEEMWTDEDEALAKQMSLSPAKSGHENPFPRPVMDGLNVYNVGHHNDRSFGATPYLFETQIEGQAKWIMVDTPRFSAAAQRDVEQLTGPKGPDYLFLTHVDDTADHEKWAEAYPGLQQIFHEGDLGRYNWLRDATLNDVEILLPTIEGDDKLTAYSIKGDVLPQDWAKTMSVEQLPVVILHTPGHSPGSITLYKRPTEDADHGVLFTGDTYAYTTRGSGSMTGFPRYGNNLGQQAETLPKLLELEWDVVAAGHGHPRDYRFVDDKYQVRADEMQVAIEELAGSRSKSSKWA